MICQECGQDHPRRANNQKYCSSKCRDRLNNRKRELRDREKRLPYKRRASAAARKRYAEAGLCSRCGRNGCDDGMKTCSSCREYVNLSRTRYPHGTKADYYNLWKEDDGNN